MQYGDVQRLTDAQHQAPLPALAGPSTGTGAAAAAPPQSIFAPTDRPWEPVTHGADAGPGAGSEVLGINNGTPTAAETSALIAGLEGAIAKLPTVSQSTIDLLMGLRQESNQPAQSQSAALGRQVEAWRLAQ